MNVMDHATYSYSELEKLHSYLNDYDSDDSSWLLFRAVQHARNDIKRIMDDMNTSFDLRMNEE